MDIKYGSRDIILETTINNKTILISN